ncbi:hypothetical protein D3C85_906210 [compost metagenome]
MAERTLIAVFQCDHCGGVEGHHRIALQILVMHANAPGLGFLFYPLVFLFPLSGNQCLAFVGFFDVGPGAVEVIDR